MIPACPETASPRWHVVQTRHLAETRAAHELGAQGYCVFLPRYLKRRSHARKVTWLPAPLFPGYLFVSLADATQRWRPVNGTLGVTRLVMGSNGPATIATGIIEELMARRDDKGYIPLRQREPLMAGEVIRITSGSFEDALGLFENFTDQNRIAVLLNLLGRKVRVVLDEDLVERAA